MVRSSRRTMRTEGTAGRGGIVRPSGRRGPEASPDRLSSVVLARAPRPEAPAPGTRERLLLFLRRPCVPGPRHCVGGEGRTAAEDDPSRAGGEVMSETLLFADDRDFPQNAAGLAVEDAD